MFPVMAASSGAVPFWFFAATTVLRFVVVLTFFPEPRGSTLENLERRLEALGAKHVCS